jgi:hypothetical protein
MVSVQEERVQQSPSGGLGLLWSFISSLILLFNVESVSKFFFGVKKVEEEDRDVNVNLHVEKPRNGVVPPLKKAAHQKFAPSRQYIPRNQGNYGHTKRIKP